MLKCRKQQQSQIIEGERRESELWIERESKKIKKQAQAVTEKKSLEKTRRKMVAKTKTEERWKLLKKIRRGKLKEWGRF